MPLKSNPDKIRAWKQRSNRRIKPKRSLDQSGYSISRATFLQQHPTCPVTGGETTQIHHSAKREGRWLLLQRYWIAVSAEGHQWIEENKNEAEKYGLMVRIREDATTHIASLQADGVNIFEPVFYKSWNNIPFLLNS